MLRMVRDGTIEAIDGTLARIEAQSICVHGDSPGAVSMARRVRARIEASGLAVRSFSTTA
jgi:UPF0271 protein